MNNAPIRNQTPSLPAGADLGARRLVKLDGTQQLIHNGLGEAPLGFTMDAETATGDAAAFEPAASAGGIVPLVGDSAIAVGAKVYAAAIGKISAAVSGIALGTALSATAADGEIANVLLD